MTAITPSVIRSVPLGEVAQSRAGKTPDRGKTEYWGGTVPWVTAKDLKADTLTDSLERITARAVADGAPLAEPGDILILVRGMMLLRDVPIGLVEAPMSFNQDVRRLRPLDDNSGEYLAWVLCALRPRLLAAVTQSGHGTGRIDSEALEALAVPIPDGKTQTWIASRLRPLRRALSALDDLIAAKRQLKRGLMQELLTGRLRFPGFHAGNWAEVALQELVRPVSRPVDWDDRATYRLVSIRRRNGGMFERELKTGSEIKTKSLFTVAAGDFVVSRMQAVHGALCVVPPEFEGGHVSGMYFTLVPRAPAGIRSEYLHYASHLGYMYRNLLRSSHGVHIEKMTFDPKRFLRTTVLVPPTLEEQDRIIDVLGSMDREIMLLDRTREAYKTQHHALMHRLLSGDLSVMTAPLLEPQLTCA